MRPVFQQIGQPSTPSCPSWETRGQTETTDEETSSTLTRTNDEAATYRVTTSQNAHGESWGYRDQSPVPEALEVHLDRGSDRQPYPGPVQLCPAWDDSVHLSRLGTVPVQTGIPQPSRSTCLLILSCGTSRLESCGSIIIARTTPDSSRRHTSSERKKTWRGFWRSWADMTSWSTSGNRDPIPSRSFICWPTWPSAWTSWSSIPLVPESSFQTFSCETKAWCV